MSIADKHARLIEIITERSLSHGSFGLASGVQSNYYFDMKPTLLDPEGASLAADLIVDRLEGRGFNAVGGLALGAIPLVTLVVVRSHEIGRPIPGFFVRKEQKERGTEKLIEGILAPGSDVVILEDVTTKGGSCLQAVEAARAMDCRVTTVITVVDRLEGAAENLAQHDIELIAITTRDDYAAA